MLQRLPLKSDSHSAASFQILTVGFTPITALRLLKPFNDNMFGRFEKKLLFPSPLLLNLVQVDSSACRPAAISVRSTKAVYRVSHKECARFREGVPYVKVYRYNPKHLYPKLNVYGDNGQRSLKL